jgi:hypothetical protein
MAYRPEAIEQFKKKNARRRALKKALEPKGYREWRDFCRGIRPTLVNNEPTWAKNGAFQGLIAPKNPLDD